MDENGNGWDCSTSVLVGPKEVSVSVDMSVIVESDVSLSSESDSDSVLF